MRRKRGLTRAKDRLASKWQDPDPELSVSQAALRQLQETDESLSAMWAIADDEEKSTVFWDKGILYRTCKNGKQWINQIVLPKQYRRCCSWLTVVPCLVTLQRQRPVPEYRRDFTGQLCSGMLMTIVRVVRCARRPVAQGCQECR